MTRKTTRKQSTGKLTCSVVRAKVLGVNVYRGFAKLCDLTEVSRADVYDQQKNPRGTQRDLSPSHARDAYEYVKTSTFGFWPEVFLCARTKDVIAFRPLSLAQPDLGTLEIDMGRAKRGRRIAISRVDGNHRLQYADGAQEGYTRVQKIVSFCLAYNLTRDEEIQLFKDINKNQKPMNTSHLDGIEVRLTPAEELKRRTPELYIAQRLSRDSRSPLAGRVYEGGKKPVGVDIPLRGLRTGIEYMMSRSTQLPMLDDAEAQYRVIRNYFEAVKKWQPKAWKMAKEYILLRGAGLWAISFIGAHVVDRTLLQDKFRAKDMLEVLNSGKDWDWSTGGDFKGLGGRGGALEISRKVTRKLQDPSRMTPKALFDEIMAE